MSDLLDQINSDLSVFIDSDSGFAVTVVITIAGIESSISGIFDNAYEEIQGEDGSVQSLSPQIIVKDSDVSGVDVNDTIVYNSITYYIVDIQPDGSGLTTLILSEDEA